MTIRDFAKIQTTKAKSVQTKIMGYANPKKGKIFKVFGWTKGVK